MTFYGYILASVLNYNLHFWGERKAYYSAAIFVGAGQLISLTALSLMIKKVAGIDVLTPLFKNGPYPLMFLMIGWLVALSYYYTLDRVEMLQKKLAEKTDTQRIIWGITAILSLAVPAILIYICSPAR